MKLQKMTYFICFSIDAYLDFVMYFLFLTSLLLMCIDNVDGREKLIKIKKLTFQELLHQSYYCLKQIDFEKINKDNLKLQLVDNDDNIVESDENVKKEFDTDKPILKITWIPIIIGKTKTVKNTITISEYIDNETWGNLTISFFKTKNENYEKDLCKNNKKVTFCKQLGQFQFLQQMVKL
ncbi:hypothetical protein RFI_19426 [Reticulomyxa filosa]|uniref:Uncharacterized protein n=1 Tax=Reticulomyxa filosa TaxID=46433 RepID=X6MVP0_RETFI|nr:hypothetical protein RFI_19426 [Reticulomyxa filosa]|eukprot:ETO17879.1 hypothetical protein RFI_19426 [Reticulomyxa filosa]